jgi:hypothetical protein
MKTLITIIAALAFASAAIAEEPRQGNFLFNADLPRNAVEIRPDFVQQDDDFWQEPPAERPKGLPATCVLVEVYQRQNQTRFISADVVEYKSVLRRIGWTYMQPEDVNWLHNPKNVSL